MTRPPGARAALRLERVGKRYADRLVLEQVSFEVGPGEIVALLGASGSGKTTLLRIVAGLVEPDEGQLDVGGRDATRLPPEARGLGYVFQDYALWPHLTALANLELVMHRRPPVERRRRGLELLEAVGLESLERARPERLSGGQRQRVALARALAVEPHLVLLDEPYSALDPVLRESLRAEVARLIRLEGRAALHVTHDPDEALSLADRLVVLGGGRVLEDGPPERVYARPSSLESARALGRLNEVDVLVTAGRARAPGVDLALDLPDGPRTLAFRWEDALAGRWEDAPGGLRARLERLAPTRGARLGLFRLDPGGSTVVAPAPGRLAAGDLASLSVPRGRLLVFGRSASALPNG